MTGTMDGLGLGTFIPQGWLVVTLVAPQHLLSERSGRSFARVSASKTVFLRGWQRARDQAEWLDFGLRAIWGSIVKFRSADPPDSKLADSGYNARHVCH